MGKQSGDLDETWTQIKDLWQRGYGLVRIAEAIPNSPHISNISRRAKREQWIRIHKKAPGAKPAKSAKQEKQADGATQTVPVRAWVPTGLSDKRNSLLDKDDLKLQVIESLKEGSTFKIASAAAGVKENTLIGWRKADPEFETACRQARAQFAQRNIARVNNAASEDWRAATWLLEKHPDTREEFKSAETAKGGGGIQVILQIPRSADEARDIVGQVIEHGRAEALPEPE
jgi:hypothetical protein